MKQTWVSTLGLLIAPVFVVLLLLGFQQISNWVLERDLKFPPSESITNMLPCRSHNHVPCKTVRYCPAGVSYIDTLMRTVAVQNGLDFDSQFESVCTPFQPGLTGLMADNVTLYSFLLDNPNTTLSAVLFTSAYAFDNSSTLPPDIELGYLMFYNNSLAQHDGNAPQFKLAIDRAALTMQLGVDASNLSMHAATQAFPVPKLRFASYDVVAANGGVWFYVPAMLIFFSLLTAIVTEKQKHLRLGLQQAGLSSIVYWLGWLCVALVLVTVSTLVLIGAGAACQFDVFLRCNFFAMFLLFFLFGMAVAMLALFVSTLVHTIKTAQAIGYSLILLGFVLQTILCSGNGVLADLLYESGEKLWVKAVRYALSLYPPFNLAKAYYDISTRAGTTFSFGQDILVLGPGFSWGDLYRERRVIFFTVRAVTSWCL